MKLYTGLVFITILLVALSGSATAATQCTTNDSGLQKSLQNCCQNTRDISGLSYNRGRGVCEIGIYFCDRRVDNPGSPQNGEEFLKTCTKTSSLNCT
ncbi:hypothetical protein BJV82DRAFT_625311 [Fennellomyces sp. T-0311]|nr:hypothetical protein BJV82DRAFT_625311 [Fennellomyces sp. T-0311]